MLLMILLSKSGTILISLLLAFLFWRDLKPQRLRTVAILLLICLAAGPMMWFPVEWGGSHRLRLITRFINMPTMGLAWWMALCLLDDDFKLGKLAFAGMIATLIPAVIFWLEDAGYDRLVFRGSGYLNPIIFSLLLAHILWVGLWGLKDDLVRLRREMRLWLVVLLTASSTLSVLSGYLLEGQSRFLVSSLIVFVGLMAIFIWIVRIHGSALEFSMPDPSINSERKIDPKDQAMHERLMYLMDQDKAYLDPALSVPKLAALVGAPPHQLRALINQQLGFRNFTAFLASYRLADVKRALSDPNKARTPILTIALDAGFASFATFNRTFKLETNQTAGEFRKAALQASE